MLIVKDQMPLHAIVRIWTLLAALRAAHELLIELSFVFHCSMDSVHYSFCEFKVYGPGVYLGGAGGAFAPP